MEVKYKLVSPDGGWSHCITVAVVISNFFTFIPLSSFGLIFGNFLASVGDETTGTTLTNGVLNTVLSFTGLASNYLLQKYSDRKVGLLGAIIFCFGAFATIFVNDLYQMILTFGIIQGVGLGLIMPASFASFNSYWDKKQNIMMGIAQALMVTAQMIFPPFIAAVKEYYGYRGTVAILAALTFFNIPAMGLLQPVKWHMKKVLIEDATDEENKELAIPTVGYLNEKSKSLGEYILRNQIEPLLNKNLKDVEETVSNTSLTKVKCSYIEPKQRGSIISIGDKTMFVTTAHLGDKKEKLTSTKSTSMDISLFKSGKYLNIAIGVSLSLTSDAAFNSILPLVLMNDGFDTPNIAFIMMVYFGADLASRILYSVLSLFVTLKSRHVFLWGSLFSAVFRTAFTMNSSYNWKLATLGVLGFLRCFIQTPLSLVFSEEYNDDFSTAFSLFMVVCGVVSLLFGPLMSVIKSVTQSDAMVIHLLSLAFLICGITWLVELAWGRIKKIFSRASKN